MGELVKSRLLQVKRFLEPLLPLANSHMVDYFRLNLIEVLNADLRKEIKDLGEQRCIEGLFEDTLPAGFLSSFIEDCKRQSLEKCCKEICCNIEDFKGKLTEVEEFKPKGFMSTKKSHEVEVLCGIAAQIHLISKTSHLIDIGDGKGYLSSTLALEHKIPVLGVDCSIINTNGSVKRLEKLTRIEKKQSSSKYYKQITQFVDESVDFTQLITDVFLEKPLGLGLVGLHTCGQLATTSLKIFTKNPNIKSLINVGCCYHFLTEPPETNFTFPLSTFLQSENFRLGRSARMIASQSVQRIFSSRILPKQTIFYRAIFEMVCEEISWNKSREVGRFRRTPTDFGDYTRQAFQRLSADEHLITDEALWEIYRSYESRQNELILFYLLRCLLAPVIESLILLDRMVYLNENGCKNVYLVRLFEEVVSPRCYGIIALK